MTADNFKPAWWLPGAHSQTIWARLNRRRVHIDTQRERLELPDGDFLDLDWVGQRTGPIVVVLHGLGGSSTAPYVQGMLSAIVAHGWRGVSVNFRGCSGEPNRLPRSYHSGETGDIRYIMAELSRREPQSPLFAVGYSLGGNVLIKYLGETGTENPLLGAVAISVPFELQKVVTHLNRGAARIYQWWLLRSLRADTQQKFQQIQAPIELGNVKKLRTFWEFDSQITAPLHGFSDVHDYYRQASSRQYLSKIAVPTLILQARDDPFVPADALPKPQELSPAVKLELTAKGGHVGFVTGKLPWQPKYWLEHRVVRYLQGYLTD